MLTTIGSHNDYFYPRSPRGERHKPGRAAVDAPPYFYPRSPRGERHRDHAKNAQDVRYFYPRSPRGERPDATLSNLAVTVISIHAPREGSDLYCCGGAASRYNISIHAPREGSDWTVRGRSSRVKIFLSTLPARGATKHAFVAVGILPDFYPRSPRGERRSRMIFCAT